MKNKFSIIIVLILLAFFYLSSVSQPKNTPPASSPTPSSSPIAAIDNLIADKRLILGPPPASASASAKQMHAKTVAKLAQTGNILGIKNCQPDPLVLQVKEGSEVEIKNNDSVAHKIMIDEDHVYELPANSSTTISAKFKYGTGDYGYICKDAGLVGFLHIVS